jgi:acyl-CoA synthetase (AMP-forming)/AMP-acid ligase II
MNIGLWLERCGRSHPEAPAVGHGDDLVLRYGELAQRAARRAGALRGKRSRGSSSDMSALP